MPRKTTSSISEAKTQVKNIVRTYLLKDAEGNYVIPQNQQDPVLLMGPPGVGKTVSVAQVANEMGIGFVSYSLAHHTRNSVLGLPVIVTGDDGKEKHTEYTMSELMAAVEEKRKQGVRIITIHPDLTDTDLYRHADFRPGTSADTVLSPEEVADAVIWAVNQRDGLVVGDITLRPQRLQIKRDEKK